MTCKKFEKRKVGNKLFLCNAERYEKYEYTQFINRYKNFIYQQQNACSRKVSGDRYKIWREKNETNILKSLFNDTTALVLLRVQLCVLRAKEELGFRNVTLNNYV